MSKKHYWMLGAIIALSGVIFANELKNISVSSLLKAASNFNWIFLVMGFGLMIVSYICEGMTLKVLEKNSESYKLDQAAFFRVPLVQSLFNAITPMSSGGQPSQLMALIQMGIEGGRATSILLMKFIIFQLVVLFHYLVTIILGFPLVASKFSGLTVLIIFGFLTHIISITFLLLIMFKYNWTKKTATKIFSILKRRFKSEKILKWEAETLDKIENFYREGMHLKQQKQKLWQATILTIIQMLSFYSIPFFVLQTFGINANYFEVLVLNIMIMMVVAIIPIPGGTGGAEYSFKMLFATFMSGQGMLVLSMFLWRFITYYFGMFIGLVALAIKPKKPTDN